MSDVALARQSERHQLQLTWALAAAMALTAVLIAAPGWVENRHAAIPGPWWFGLLPLFAATEVVVIHLPTQRNAHGHTLREIPAVLGLTFLAPQQYVTVYVVGAVAGLVVAAHMGGVKLAFNGAMFALEATLGALTYHAVLQDAEPLSLTGWIAVLAAVVVTDLISAAAVTAAISLSEGAFDGEVLNEALRSGFAAAFINTCVALLVATLVLVQPTALPLLAVVVVLLVLAYRVYISLARGHAQTQLLYRFVERTSSARSTEDVVEVVLREAADLMHAEQAHLVEVVDGLDVRHHSLVAGTRRDGTLSTPDPGTWWWPALESGVVRHERARHDGAGVLDAHTDSMSSPRDGLAASLPGEGSTRYLLLVCDRSFEKETFGSEDVKVFEALAAHVGVALERARSVSDLEALAAELEVARDAALAASEAKSLFLANMGHEIRTPLTIMLATSEILEDTDLDGLQRNLLERMQRSGGSLKTLVEALLDFSRMEAGQLGVISAPFDLHALVGSTVEEHRLRAEREGRRFVCRLSSDLPRTVLGDAHRLRQVVGNLLDNALKFTPEGGRVELDVHGSADATDPAWVEVVVRDTGIGIAAEDQVAIFEAFSQVDATATRLYEGTGLGLAMCRQLVHLMGGTISVESRVGSGSTFTVRVPLAEVPDLRVTGLQTLA